MVQVREMKHVDTKKLTEDLRKIGIVVTSLQVDIGVDRMTSVTVTGRYIDNPLADMYTHTYTTDTVKGDSLKDIYTSVTTK